MTRSPESRAVKGKAIHVKCPRCNVSLHISPATTVDLRPPVSVPRPPAPAQPRSALSTRANRNGESPDKRPRMRLTRDCICDWIDAVEAETSTQNRVPSAAALRGILRESGIPPRHENLEVRLVDTPLVRVISPAPSLVEPSPSPSSSSSVSSESFFDETPFPRHADLRERLSELTSAILPIIGGQTHGALMVEYRQAVLRARLPLPAMPLNPPTPLPAEGHDQLEVSDSVGQSPKGVDSALSFHNLSISGASSATTVPEMRALVRLAYPSGHHGLAVLTMRVGTSSSVQAGDSLDAARERFLGYCNHFHQPDSTSTRSDLEYILFEIEGNVVGAVPEGVLNEHASGGGDLASRLVDMARSVCSDCHEINVTIA
ncbi:uncharacterized protein SCHCODRAFT_02613606, partial [Schizophyllum commune H4-8]|uniref:uncharacterized protein n=1 Tax=Schizophyllum commune (strain H4-8 / FGSC 9210) TaxID=578458 RepID=UPI00215DFCAF